MPMKQNSQITFNTVATRSEFDVSSSRILPPRLLSNAIVLPENQWRETIKMAQYVSGEGGQKVLIEFFPAVRLNGEYMIDELYVQQLNDDDFILIGRATKLSKLNRTKYVNYGARPSYSSFSPWSSGGCASGSLGGCFTGVLSLIGLLFLIGIIACLFGACDLLRSWCPCLFEQFLK